LKRAIENLGDGGRRHRRVMPLAGSRVKRLVASKSAA
jgi:hypothetical protein